jgi:hypothetical protein
MDERTLHSRVKSAEEPPMKKLNYDRITTTIEREWLGIS